MSSGNGISSPHRGQAGLGFWAQRKAAVEAEAQEEARLAVEDARAEREAELAERPDEEILAELNLPDPDSLGAGDDFKVFLQDAVPARIRTRALRRLWRVNPVLANVDGLVDYGEDFNDASFIVENMQTAYQVGKGMTKHLLELSRQAEEAPGPEELPEDEQAPEAEQAPAPEPVPSAEPPVPAAHAPEDPADTPRPQRRMRFAFDQEAT